MRLAADFINDLLGDRNTFRVRSAEGSFVLRQHIDPADLLTWEEFNRVLNFSGIERNLIKDSERTNSATVEQVMHEVPDGATIQLESLTPFSPHLAEIAGELEVALGGEQVDVNIYLAPSCNHRAFGTHHDVVDVFVCQIAGKKRWRIYEPIIDHPIWHMKNHRYDLDEDSPTMDVTLEPGDVLFMRRGDPHNVQCVGVEPSLHVNLRIIPTTRKLFLDWVVQEAADEASFRTALPYALDGTDVTAERIDWVAAKLAAPNLVALKGDGSL